MYHSGIQKLRGYPSIVQSSKQPFQELSWLAREQRAQRFVRHGICKVAMCETRPIKASWTIWGCGPNSAAKSCGACSHTHEANEGFLKTQSVHGCLPVVVHGSCSHCKPGRVYHSHKLHCEHLCRLGQAKIILQISSSSFAAAMWRAVEPIPFLAGMAL